jgi:hypothetical protein
MSRLFLTNIDLNTNELQNAVIQNLSSAPASGNTEGRIYYDSTRKTLRVWRNDTLQGAKWYDLSVGGASASTVTLTGDVTGSGSVDPATGIITLATTLNVSGTEDQITVQDINNVTTISLPSYINISNGELHLAKTEYWRDGSQYGVVAANNYGDAFSIASVNYPLQLESHTGDIQLLPDSGVVTLGTGSGELHLAKTEYWRDGTKQGIIAAQSDGSLRLTGNNNGLQLESNSGNVSINSGSGTTYFNNEISINSEGQIATQNSDLLLSPDTGIVVVNNTLVTDNISSTSSGASELNINANQIQITSTDVTIGGGGTNGGLNVKDSNGTNVFVVDTPTQTATFSGNVNVEGDLNVRGTLTAINKQEIDITDNTIVLNSNFTSGVPSQDAAIQVNRGSANTVGIVWSESNKDWTLTNDGNNYFAVARKVVFTIGDASNTSFDLVHNLGTRDLTVQVRENNAEYNLVETDVRFKDENTLTIACTDAPNLNAYKVVIVG